MNNCHTKILNLLKQDQENIRLFQGDFSFL